MSFVKEVALGHLAELIHTIKANSTMNWINDTLLWGRILGVISGLTYKAPSRSWINLWAEQWAKVNVELLFCLFNSTGKGIECKYSNYFRFHRTEWHTIKWLTFTDKWAPDSTLSGTRLCKTHTKQYILLPVTSTLEGLLCGLCSFLQV